MQSVRLNILLMRYFDVLWYGSLISKVTLTLSKRFRDASQSVFLALEITAIHSPINSITSSLTWN